MCIKDRGIDGLCMKCISGIGVFDWLCVKRVSEIGVLLGCVEMCFRDRGIDWLCMKLVSRIGVIDLVFFPSWIVCFPSSLQLFC